MTAKLLDGNKLGEQIKMAVKADILTRQAQGLSTPGLTVILVGDDPASHAYVGRKEQACQAVGIRSTIRQLPANVDETTLIAEIERCNNDATCHGILVQLPLPKQINTDHLLELIHPKKDVDGFHPYNLGRLVQRRPLLRPCTPYGIIKLLNQTGEKIAGKHAVVIGASNIVGRPMALELLLAKCTVTICHRFTENLQQQVEAADILVVAIGKPNVIQSAWIKPGAMVIDVGFNRLDDGKIVGDVCFPEAEKRASWITPVPGGVGPMTVATLMENTLHATRLWD